MNIIFKNYMLIRSARLRREVRAKLKDLKSTSDSFVKLYEDSLEQEISLPSGVKNIQPVTQADTREMYEKGLYVLTLIQDVYSLSLRILIETEPWSKKNLGRQLSVLMYEGIDDLLKIFGGDFRAYLQSLPHSKELEGGRQSITSQIKEFKKRNNDYLKDVRHFCGAHLDHNGYKMVKIIEGIDPSHIFNLTSEFMSPVNDLIPYLETVFSSMTQSNVDFQKRVGIR